MPRFQRRARDDQHEAHGQHARVRAGVLGRVADLDPENGGGEPGGRQGDEQPGADYAITAFDQYPLFRLYMGYLIPLLCEIDEGTERWIRPSELPAVEGAAWRPDVDYYTFLPDFTPRTLLRLLRPMEARLERSRVANWSAHFTARLVRTATEGVRPGSDGSQTGDGPLTDPRRRQTRV